MAGEEILDPGPTVWGEVEFVTVRHPDTGGVAEVPAHLVEHHRQRGWEPFDAPSPPEVAAVAEEASLSMKRADLDDLATAAGVVDPASLPSKQAVLDAIAAIDPTHNPSSPDDDLSQED